MCKDKKCSISCLSLILVAVFTFQAFAAVPKQISYQGKLTDDNGMPVPDADYALTLRIFDTVSGGTPLWAENQTVSVTGGIYNVILGMGTTTTGSFDHTLFSVDNRWLEVVVDGEVLSPRQRVNTVAYSFNSETLDGHPAEDFANAEHSHPETDPTVLSWVKDGVSWSEVTSKPAGFADNIDDVGVTTESDPTVPASVKDGVSWSEVTSKPAGFADNIDDVGVTTESDPTVLASVKDGITWSEIANRPAGLDDGDDIGGTTGRELVVDSPLGIHDWTLSSTGDSFAGTGYFFIKDKTSDTLRFTIDQNSGLVSVNTLWVGGSTKINVGGGSFDFTTPGGWPGIIGLAKNGYRREIALKDDFMWILAGDSAAAPDATHGISIRNNGDVGIGTSSPSDKLHVIGNMKVQGSDGWNSIGDEAMLSLGSVFGQFFIKAIYGDALRLGAYATTDAFVLKQSTGNVGIGTATPATKLDVNGETTTKVLRITGGADIAEPFDIKTNDAVEPGMVLTIDPKNPGKLRISDKAYDRRVAGIVSAAGDIQPGMILSQTGSMAAGEYPVALTGRVYCWADTSNGAIEPGDLLTTSDRPGHAMKVSEYTRAQGAILGKAMSSLKEDKGLVMVLVTLQ